VTPAGARDGEVGVRGQTWFAGTIRFLIAPLILFLSGFFTADFALSGVYTWPRTSRVLVLTVTIAVLAYEFVYKEQRALQPDAPGALAVKAILYSCALPYALGVAALVALARM
jgi:hypothetical protein